MKAQLNQIQSTVKTAIDQLGARAGATRQTLRAEADRRVAAVREVLTTGRQRVETLTRDAASVRNGLRARLEAVTGVIVGVTRHPLVVRGLSHPVALKLVQRLPAGLARHLQVDGAKNDAAREEGGNDHG
jgi:hypothetical protein